MAKTAIDLTEGRKGAAPLWLLSDGSFSTRATGAAPAGTKATDALVTAARWISSRRTVTFEQLLSQPGVGLTLAQADGLFTQLTGALAAAAVGSAGAKRDPIAAAQLRSASLTVLSHMVGTAEHARTWRAAANRAAAAIFSLIDAENGSTARPALRAHAILLLQQRGPALSAVDRRRVQKLLGTLVRTAPPYADLPGPWHFAMCSDPEFHDGECNILIERHKFRLIPTPADTPKPPGREPYRVFEAPFLTPDKKPIYLFARASYLEDEDHEMSLPWFVGLLINRHAQLGIFDLQAAVGAKPQNGYKLMMNSQCCGLTTRYELHKLYPDADIYSSYDSTQFEQNKKDVVTASEGNDCWVALMLGMSYRNTHAQLDAIIRKAQWDHGDALPKGEAQFVGPSHPALIARFEDLGGDGPVYDGFLDFYIKSIAEDLHESSTPRDPGCKVSQIGGEAQAGLDWSAGSLDRATKYSEFWALLPKTEEFEYVFQNGGFFSPKEPAEGFPVAARGALKQDLSKLPALCRYQNGKDSLSGDILFNSWLSHAGKELKRLLCAADAFWRAIDQGILPKSKGLATPAEQRGALLLLLAGLMAFPAETNFLDGLWAEALKMLRFPVIERATVADCITEKDHDADHYYGGLRSLYQLIGQGKKDRGDLGRLNPAARLALDSDDLTIGRAAELNI